MRSFHRFPGYTYAALVLGILAPLLAAASDGELDPGFSGNGKAVVGFTVNATAVSAYATAMTIQPDGKIVLAPAMSNPATPLPRWQGSIPMALATAASATAIVRSC